MAAWLDGLPLCTAVEGLQLSEALPSLQRLGVRELADVQHLEVQEPWAGR